MLNNPFIRAKEDYVRELNILNQAVEDAAYFLHIKSRKPINDCKEFVKKNILPDGKFPIKPKMMNMTRRKDNGDRVKHQMTIEQLMNGVEKSQSILSPNMVVYANPIKKRSFLSKFIDDKMAMRSIVKKQAAEAKKNNDKQTMTYYDNQQTNIKTLTNSLSGAQGSPHNPHFLKTAHSSLTSATRIATSYSNANTERLLIGNRHYYNADITYQNIVSICRNTDYHQLTHVVNKYNLNIPSPEDTLSVIERSTKVYWINPIEMEKIKELIFQLNPLERVAISYTGDLFHLAKFNDQFMRDWVTEIITTPNTRVDNPDQFVQNANEDIIALCGILCKDILAGTDAKRLKESDYEKYLLYASTVAHVEKSIHGRYDLINIFLVTDNMPASIYQFPSSIRKVVVGSDTDSTMYTCQDWVEWYCGKLLLDQTAQNVSATLMYFNTQVTAHMLAMISRQMGVEDKNLFRLKMKNEYSFLVYMVANRTKHYVTLINAKEGNIYKKPEIEIKGVALKDSKLPPKIISTLEHMFKESMEVIMRGEKIRLHDIMQRIANIEHEIVQSINNGNIEYYGKVYIRTKEAYKVPMVSNYAHYDFWQSCFQLKYGAVSNPPIQCIKLSNTLDTPKKFTTWVNSIDPIIGEKIKQWQETNNKTYMGQFILPLEVVRKGIPKEFISAIDTRGLLKELMQGFYIYLEILGLYMRNDGITRLLSDDIQYRPELGGFIKND